jgi:O-antigen ligase
MRPIAPDELSSADRGVLSMLSWLSILLVVMDGIPSRERLDALLRRLATAGGIIATLGVAQFVTGQSFTEYLHLPGLVENGDLVSVSSRQGFARPAATALHPIEFGVVMTIILPIALHYAVTDRHRSLAARWFPAVAIAIALPISLSRSAIVGTAVGLAVLLPSWPRAFRRRAYAGVVVLGAGMFVALPGFLGSLLGLFTGIGSDDSARSRTDSYAIAWSFITRAPVFGRGFGTFLPRYRILDNSYLGALIEIGVFGVGALLVLFGTALVTAFQERHRSTIPRPSLGPAVAGAIAAGSVSFALFDTLSFPMVSGLVFFMTGVPGALRRIKTEGDMVPPDTALSESRDDRSEVAGLMSGGEGPANELRRS